MQKIDHVRSGLGDIGRRSNQKRIQRNIIATLGLDPHAKRIQDLAAGCRHDVHVVEPFTKDHICRLEYGKRRKAQIRKPWRQQKTDRYDVDLPWGYQVQLRVFWTQSWFNPVARRYAERPLTRLASSSNQGGFWLVDPIPEQAGYRHIVMLLAERAGLSAKGSHARGMAELVAFMTL
jgi:hypothetical protein